MRGPDATPQPEHNIAWHLASAAANRPDEPALHVPVAGRADRTRYLTLSCAQLNLASDSTARGLRALGLGPGARVALLTPPSEAFFVLTFAVFKAGASLVGIDPGLGAANLGRCLAEAQPHAFIGITKAHLARRLLGWAPTATRRIATRRLPFNRLLGVTHDLPGLLELGRSRTDLPALASVQASDDAAILFTSGSTGAPKGVLYSHGNFQAQVHALRDAFGITPGEVDLCTFPLFALFAPALGMTAVVPRMDFTRPGAVDPIEIASPVNRFHATHLFGSPALLRRVASQDPRTPTPPMPTLRRVISAGAPAHAPTLRRFAALLGPGACIHTPYGATEALPVCTIESREVLNETAALTAQGRGVCVGLPVGDTLVRIIPLTDGPLESGPPLTHLPAGRVGEVAVSGPVVTRAYFRRDQANRHAKVIDDHGVLWHRMGDVGLIDERGRLWVCGRKSQRVVTADRDYHSLCCEGVLDDELAPQGLRTALVGIRLDGVTHPVALVERGPKGPHWPPILNALLLRSEQHEATRGLMRVLRYPRRFPVDIRHNAKFGRERLAIWAANQLRAQPAIPVNDPRHLPTERAR